MKGVTLNFFFNLCILHLYHSTEAGWEAEREPTGFFPPASTARTVSRQTAEESSKRELPALKPPLEPAFAPINPSGFIPNSILIHLLWPPREEEEEEEGEEIGVYKPPQLSQEQLNQIASLQAVSIQCLNPYAAGGYFSQYKMMQRKTSEMTEPLAHVYSSDSTQQELSNEY